VIEDEVQKYWDQLVEDGIALMELGSYSWSKNMAGFRISLE
jgi:uncharacterized glyoxalase superfamily protein PhnB